MKSQFGRQRTRRDVTRPAERGENVIQRIFVRYIHGCEPQADLVLIATKQVVVAHRDVEQVAGSDPRGIVVVVFGSRRWNGEKRRTVLRSRAEVGATEQQEDRGFQVEGMKLRMGKDDSSERATVIRRIANSDKLL